jgi:hypothetical protein
VILFHCGGDYFNGCEIKERGVSLRYSSKAVLTGSTPIPAGGFYAFRISKK